MNETILIIDDEEDIRFSLRGILEDEGYQVVDAEDGEVGLQVFGEAEPSLVFLDIWLPGKDGLTVLETMQAQAGDVPVVMISGHGTIETAVDAIKKGAFDFIEKPLSLEKVVVTAKKALEFRNLKEENRDLRSRIRERHVHEITGSSQPVLQLKEMIAQVAPTDAWVLITGENGTGKEIVARSIHARSPRASSALVAVNCAAIPEELIESELFGHEKGSFTGADKSKKGKFELADKGTLFLDEIGDMSLKTQAKILRILQEQCFERVGGSKTIRVDVRVVAATNKDLAAEIKEGRFREDLYYRLRVFPLEVPPLRQRQGDIVLILNEFMEAMVREHGFRPIQFADDALAVLQGYSWPGNVRELKNFVERIFILYQGQVVNASMLPGEYRQSVPSTSAGKAQDASAKASLPGDFKTARNEFEIRYLKQKLAECNGNISRLAETIGLERSYLYRKLKAYNITP
ncbi:sigma-54-dependent transcriptional regulator [Desulfoplanes formicivorans]|uniref:Fis family transcriptional regulator n=1 Tax=Desulfoplanes formicivorans TaxID=1592317 RepID=A0A194AL76_9BACT|nr:sigma-54 dependent transcriptional regulator [Desulfoplanes formicivorans]GAU09791.1 Fis family transcriptional regulator [Desulfoplanes formicivorans]